MSTDDIRDGKRRRRRGRDGSAQWRGGPPWRRQDEHRPRHGSVLLAVLAGAVEIGGARVIGHHQIATTLDHLGYTLLAISALALPFRVRWRVASFEVTLAATLVYVVLGYPAGPVFLALLISMFGAVRTGHRITVWISLGTAYVVFLCAGALLPTLGNRVPRQPGVLMSIQVAVWFVLALAIAEAIRVRSAHFVEVRRTMAEQKRARDEQERRQASEERLRIAQELHDVLGHHLSLINVQAGVGLHLMDEHPDQARAALEAIKQASTEALGEVRSVLSALRPKDEKAPRAPAPSLADLATLIDPANTVLIGEARPLPPDVERAAYRIVQESLTNVRRHAGPAAIATVTINYGAARLSVRVADDGSGTPGATNTSSGGTGIAGMRTRAEALGGSLVATGTASGFVVTATLPLSAIGPSTASVPSAVSEPATEPSTEPEVTHRD